MKEASKYTSRVESSQPVTIQFAKPVGFLHDKLQGSIDLNHVDVIHLSVKISREWKDLHEVTFSNKYVTKGIIFN